MSESPSRVKTLLAFAAIYLIWGSTYLAIKAAVHTIPPFLMAGTRFLIAGSLMAAWCAWKREPPANRTEIRQALIVGLFLLVGGNGLVTWAEQRIPSGLAALLVGSEPLWLAILLWLGIRGAKPTRSTVAAICLGLVGVGLLVVRGSDTSTRLDLLGVGALMIAPISWALGSIYASRQAPPKSFLRQAAWQMSTGGAIMVAIGLVRGEAPRVHLGSVSAASALAYLYLVVFGSLVAFQAYTYLLRATTATKASTYAYVNPVVAVLLGWLMGGEALGPRELAGCVVIVGAVVILSRSGATSSLGKRTDRAVVQVPEPEEACASTA